MPKTPPEPLTLTVHGLAAPDLADPALAAQRRTVRGRVKMALVLAVCAAPVIASYLTYFVIRPEGRSNYSDLVVPTRAMPELGLQTLQGQAVSAASLRGQWLLLVLGPSACAADCQRRLFLQRQLREMLGRERERLDKVWLVTDEGMPAAALRVAAGGPAPLTLLRAPRDALAAWLAPQAGRALEDHLYLVDPMGQWMMRVPPDPDPAKLKRDLDRVLRASAGWDRAGR